MTRSTFEAVRPGDYLERLARSEVGSAYKALVIDALQIGQADVVLDLGCGPGTDLPAFVDAVGPRGSVIGLDCDPDAVAAARARTAGLGPVTVRLTDVHHVDLPDAGVDRVHTDRVLQHVADPARVVREAARCLRPGGRAVFAEPDWDTFVIDHVDIALAQTYRRFVVEDVVRNATVGRRLHRLAREAGLTVDAVLPVTATFLDAAEADRVLGMRRVTERAVSSGRLDGAGAQRWLDHLESAPFFASVTLFAAVCTRPAAPVVGQRRGPTRPFS